MDNQTRGCINTQVMLPWPHPPQCLVTHRSSLLGSHQGELKRRPPWPNPFLKSGLFAFAFRKKICSTALARPWEDSDVWAQVSAESSVSSAGHSLSYPSQFWDVLSRAHSRLKSEFNFLVCIGAGSVWTSSSLEWDFWYILCYLLFLTSLLVPSSLLPVLLHFLMLPENSLDTNILRVTSTKCMCPCCLIDC